MDDNKALTEVDRKYLTWMAAGVKFARDTEKLDSETKALIMEIGSCSDGPPKVPVRLAPHMNHIKLYRRFFNLSIWLFDNYESVIKIKGKYDDWNEKEFVKFYNDNVTKRS